MIKALPKEFLSVISQNDGMLRYLDSLSVGRDFTPRSWLYEHEEPDQILANWQDILSKLEQGNTFEKRVYQFDTSQLAKWGPQGGIAPMSELLDEYVKPSFSKHSPAKGFMDGSWNRAKTRVLRDFKTRDHIRSVVPVAYKRVVDDMRARDTLESNSGWPDFTRRNKPEVIKAAIAAAADGDWESYPAIALFRNYNLKTRLVWMFPMATNVYEGQFVQAFQNAIINSGEPFVAPWVGFEKVRQFITRAYDPSINAFLYATDFSKTDEHFTLSSTLQVYDVLRELLREKDQCIELRRSLERMHKIPLIISADQMITGLHGVASGSNWTNFVETIFDDLFGYYVADVTAMNYGWRISGLYGIGDDMCWIGDEFYKDFPEVVSELGSLVGQDVNAEKVTAEPDAVKTLQRLFQRGYNRPDGLCRGVYSTIRALKSSIYPERFHKPSLWSSDMFCARQYMILENCVDHPLFEEFVKFVVKGQKDLVPFAKKDANDLRRITRETKLLPGFNPTYNQEKKDTSLAKFASIEIARKL